MMIAMDPGKFQGAEATEQMVKNLGGRFENIDSCRRGAGGSVSGRTGNCHEEG